MGASASQSAQMNVVGHQFDTYLLKGIIVSYYCLLVCGACKEGKLIPLFSDAKKTPKTPKTSRNASIKPQGKRHSWIIVQNLMDSLVFFVQTLHVHFLAL
jgi:hypothetical protein